MTTTRFIPADALLDVNRVLADRARALAKPIESSETTLSSLELLVFRLAQEQYAIETRYVSEIQPLKDLTPLPCTPAFLLGVVNVRGRILPVLELKRFFDLPEKGIADLHRLILVRGNGMEFCIMADTIEGITTIPTESLQPTLPTLTGIRAEYLKGITVERLIVLDMAAIIADPKIIVHEEILA